MIRTRTASVLIMFAIAAGTAGCSRVNDPWVPSDSYLKQERTRTAASADQLRQRMVETQNDR